MSHSVVLRACSVCHVLSHSMTMCVCVQPAMGPLAPRQPGQGAQIQPPQRAQAQRQPSKPQLQPALGAQPHLQQVLLFNCLVPVLGCMLCHMCALSYLCTSVCDDDCVCLSPLSGIMLSTQQKEVVETALDEKGPNMFITGVAGSGKTRVLHEIIR